VQRTIRRVQRTFRFDTLRLDRSDIADLSTILAEFAEDLHNDIGIWRAYEDGNRAFFGVALPITEGEDNTGSVAISAHRVSAFARTDGDLSDIEADAIKEFVLSRSVSPAFVRRMVSEHGDGSVRAAFLLRECGNAYAVEYLLRRYKGNAFRQVYPNISLVHEGR